MVKVLTIMLFEMPEMQEQAKPTDKQPTSCSETPADNIIAVTTEMFRKAICAAITRWPKHGNAKSPWRIIPNAAAIETMQTILQILTAEGAAEETRAAIFAQIAEGTINVNSLLAILDKTLNGREIFKPDSAEKARGISDQFRPLIKMPRKKDPHRYRDADFIKLSQYKDKVLIKYLVRALEAEDWEALAKITTELVSRESYKDTASKWIILSKALRHLGRNQEANDAYARANRCLDFQYKQRVRKR